jgi:hypothetical protein
VLGATHRPAYASSGLLDSLIGVRPLLCRYTSFAFDRRPDRIDGKKDGPGSLWLPSCESATAYVLCNDVARAIT